MVVPPREVPAREERIELVAKQYVHVPAGEGKTGLVYSHAIIV